MGIFSVDRFSLGRYCLLIVAIFCVVIGLAPISSSARPTKPGKRAPLAKAFPASIEMADAGAQKFPNGIKISWVTMSERNVLGFRIWRDSDGKRNQVNEMVPGGTGKIRDGELPNGDSYFTFDLNGSEMTPYWIEAVDINSKSTWYGPVYAVPNYNDADGDAARIASWSQRVGTVQSERPASTAKSNPVAPAMTMTSERLANDANAVKIEIRQRGIYRIPAQSLADHGFSLATVANWKMFVRGVEQSIDLMDDGSIEFFGEGIDTIQTDANVYWLTTDVTTGRRFNHSSQNFIQNAHDSFSRVVVEKRERTMRIASVLNGTRDNWFGSYVGNALVTKTLDLRDIATGGNLSATLGIDLQGISNLTHQVEVTLNGSVIGQISFNSFDRKAWTATVPVSALINGTNTITLRSLNTASDYSLTEALRIEYPRLLLADGDQLEFIHDDNQAIKLRRFSSPQVTIYDVTDPTQVSAISPETRLESDGTYTVTVSGTSSPKTMIAVGGSVPQAIADPLITVAPGLLRDPSNRAKLIVIAEGGMGKALSNFHAKRNAQGIETRIISVNGIYDEFGDGIKSAEAIRSFLMYAKQNWEVKPDYVIFAGDATVDPRNFSGLAGERENNVPTMFVDTWNMEAASDEMLVDFDDDGVGEIASGRLPASTREELEFMEEKILMMDELTLSDVADRGVVMVSDDNIGYNFAAGSRNMATRIPGSVAPVYIDRTTQDPAALRSEIVGRMNDGAAIVNYFGHASVVGWTSSGILRNVDADSMFSNKKSTLILALACLNGDFTVFGTKSLAESMMKRDRGGAFAVWAASGWNGAFEEEMMGRDLYQRIFAGMPLGDAIREVKILYPTLDMRRTFILFGDPTQRLVNPSSN